MTDPHYIEITTIVGPIAEPHVLHTHDGEGGLDDTEHGRLAQRIFTAVTDIAPHADMSAHITTEANERAALIAERNRLRAVVEAFMNGDADDLTEALAKLDASGNTDVTVTDIPDPKNNPRFRR